ncbi:MAG: SprT family zinc-dependent metalloprotease [Sideroxydans sp.]
MPPPAIEQRILQLPQRSIPYTLKRGRRRSIGLRIDERGLTVNVPQRVSEQWLYRVLQDKAEWVIRKLQDWQSRQVPRIAWADGARIPFRGEELTLRLLPRQRGAKVQLVGEVLQVPLGAEAEGAAIERAVLRWYRLEALQVFNECVAYFAPLLAVTPREIRLSSARTQWGSCSARGVVRFNWQLVKMPLPLIDYVVVHELAHLIEMNHSAAFWRVVERACPDYRERRKALQAYGLAE